MKLIDKDALVAEIENLENTYKKCPTRNSYEDGLKDGRLIGYKDALHKIDTLEVKEMDLEKAIDDYIYTNNGRKRLTLELDWKQCDVTFKTGKLINFAKHFFELGLNTNNPITPITEVNLKSLVRQVIDLYLEAGEHYNSVIKEERKEYGGSDLVIKLLDGVIDAKELSIQYVLDKLKAQKEEEV